MRRLLHPPSGPSSQRLASQYGILGSARSSHSTMRTSFSASDVPLNSPHGPKERRFSTNKEPTDSGKNISCFVAVRLLVQILESAMRFICVYVCFCQDTWLLTFIRAELISSPSVPQRSWRTQATCWTRPFACIHRSSLDHWKGLWAWICRTSREVGKLGSRCPRGRWWDRRLLWETSYYRCLHVRPWIRRFCFHNLFWFGWLTHRLRVLLLVSNLWEKLSPTSTMSITVRARRVSIPGKTSASSLAAELASSGLLLWSEMPILDSSFRVGSMLFPSSRRSLG
jgi:hypothetical protein